jgi:peptidoglycan hydrolase-like protein with peptidoglycan-binding domain
MGLFDGKGIIPKSREWQEADQRWLNAISQPEHKLLTDEELRTLRQYEIDKLKAGRPTTPIQNPPANTALPGRSVISNTYVNYYTTNINPTYGEPVTLPVPPDSRLQPIGETPDTFPYQDKKQPVITVEQSLAQKQWGRLLHEPLSGNSIRVKTFDTSAINKAIGTASDKSLDALNKWIREGGDINQNDLSLIFIDKLNTETGEIARTIAYGSDSISYLYASYQARSLNVGEPAITSVSKSVAYDKSKSVIPKIFDKDIGFGYIPGSDSFEEIEVPETLTDPDKNKPKKLTNSGQAIAYLIQIIDELVGEFPLKITIEDSDLTSGGNQSKTIEIPNLSEGIAEIFGLVFNNNQYGQLNSIFGTHTMAMTIQGLISSNITQEVSLAVADYLGFKLGEVERKIKLPVDPTKGKISEILKATEMSYPSYDFQDTKNLQADLVRFNEAAGIIKASMFKKFNINNLENEIKDYLGLLGKKGPDANDEKWREFLNQVELGYEKYKRDDTENPYQNNYEQRPLIRDLTNGNQSI